ncbi:MAG TPA: type II pantothenate kinase [Bacillus bacterium]|nr:type II pantothenate kinase [Bacillus sp. (in: firmicutes)]
MSHDTIGIDAGGSLIKIAFEENGRIRFRKYSIEDVDGAMSWMRNFSANKKIVLTGGKAGMLKAKYFPDAEVIDEFTAACEGAKFLMQKNELHIDDNFLLVNVGTGTSWFHIKGDKFERILGSGVGGGTLIGLGSLLAGVSEFSELVKLAAKGNRGNVDLLVKDIFHPGEPPIPGELTASNFAKSALITESSNSDRMAAVINMISETLTLLTVQAAALKQTKKVIYIGSTLAGNKPLQSSLDFYAEMSGIEPVFLPDGEYSGAIGAKKF